MFKLYCAVVAVASTAAASDCTRVSTGLHPLDGPFFRMYKGFAGGLYPNGSNVRPAAHETAGRAQAALVRPRNASGDPDPNGRIVLLSIGMSNTTQEFSAFQAIATQESARNPRVQLVDGAQGGMSADRIVADPASYWNTVDQRLRAAGASASQVQVAWLKEADAGPTLPFPSDATKLQSEIQTILQQAKARFPNLRLVYLSSRIYAGYATSNLNPEPFAYQTGFAVKWLIEAQINGDPALDYASGKMPWLAWGPYLWADGTTMRQDGLVWNCSDLQAADGTHPSDDGRLKVARMLLDFFKTDTTARPWFVAATTQPAAPKPMAVVNSAGYFATVAPGGIASIFGSDLASANAQAMSLPLPYGMLGTTVTVGGAPAPVYFVSPGQINFVVPAEVSGSTVVVAREGSTSASIDAAVALNTEGLFSSPADGSAAAAHLDGSIVSTANPARPGETISIYGTGFGVRNPAVLAPQVLPNLSVGGVLATVLYAGPAHVYPGLDQINATIAAKSPTGDAIAVVVQSPAFTSNAVRMAVAVAP